MMLSGFSADRDYLLSVQCYCEAAVHQGHLLRLLIRPVADFCSTSQASKLPSELGCMG